MSSLPRNSVSCSGSLASFGVAALGCVPLLGLVLLLLPGCATSQRPEPPPDAARAAPPRRPHVTGESTLLEGTLVVSASVTPPPRSDGGDSGPGGHGGPPPGGGRGMGGDMGPPPGGQPGGAGGQRGPLPAPMRHLLVVTLHNQGNEPITCEILTMDSALGNFAPSPSRITIPPGGSVTLDPMLSNRQVTLEGLKLSVSVRRGDQEDGTTIVLQPDAPPP